MEPIGLVPPAWNWIPVTMLLAPLLVALHVDRVAGRNDRSGGRRLTLASVSAIVVVGALLGLEPMGRGACVDNEWLSTSRGGSAATRLLVLLMAWFVLIAGVYVAAGLRSLALVAPTAIALAAMPGFVVELGFSWSALDTYCSGGGLRGLVVHLAVASLVPIGATMYGLVRTRRRAGH